MIYKLRFHAEALAEWQKLDGSIKRLFKKKLAERLTNPRNPASALSGMDNCYKIKLLSHGYRLVYRVEDDIVFVTVVAIGRRDKGAVYQQAAKRIK